MGVFRIIVGDLRDNVDLLATSFWRMSSLSFAARSSIDAEAGTEAVITSIPLALRASVMPRQ